MFDYRDKTLNKYDYAYKLQKEADIWASMDGCEGGDFLSSLGNTVSMIHYSQHEDYNYDVLVEILEKEIETLIGWWFTEGREHNEEEYMHLSLESVKKVWKNDSA